MSPDKIIRNNTCHIGDDLILTKILGVGIVTSAYKADAASQQSYQEAVGSMETLNKYAAEVARKYRINACTDVTGFGFLGHLNEMVTQEYSIKVNSRNINFISEAYRLAQNYLVTGGGQKNRDFLHNKVSFIDVQESMKEILFDPQTSGGLLLSVHPDDTSSILEEMKSLDIPCSKVGIVIPRDEKNVIVYG